MFENIIHMKISTCKFWFFFTTQSTKLGNPMFSKPKYIHRRTPINAKPKTLILHCHRTGIY